jgi:hypothetical protein
MKKVLLPGILGGLLVFVWSAVWNWYRFPPAFAIGEGLDHVIGWLLAGFLIAWLIQRAEKKAAV